jgi:hypothetical protein
MGNDTWAADWEARMRSLVEQKGFHSVFEFVMSQGGESFGEVFEHLRQLAGPLDSRNLAFVQLAEVFYIDASKAGRLRAAVTEALARSLRQFMRSGWNRGKRVRERRIDVLMHWPVPSTVSNYGWDYSDWRDFKKQVFEELESSNPPDDWCPASGEDPILCNLKTLSRVESEGCPSRKPNQG